MKKHIVLIEDEAGIRDNYRAAFERRGVGIATIHHFLSPACPLLPR